jgi:glycosyltransferase involved in cell wall biosynthesis
MEIHQLSSGFGYGDAISNHALALRALLRSWGYTSEIYARWIEAKVAPQCRRIQDYAPTPGSIAIYHYSIGADEVSRRFLDHPGKRMLIYHNITPHQFFERYSKRQVELTRTGRELLGSFAPHVDLALGDSTFNCAELAERGFTNPRVLPLLIDFEHLAHTRPCPATLGRYNDDWINFLFVGRVAPNKCQEDVIRAFAHYSRWIKRRSRLFLVGHWLGMDQYHAELRAFVESLGVRDQVVFAGHVELSELVAFYRLADVFLCMSEHEGFCVPLLEALHFDVPVLAYAATAVPDTLGDSGILFTRKDIPIVAETAHLLATDRDLREAILRRQRSRLEAFQPQPVALRFQSYIAELAA